MTPTSECEIGIGAYRFDLVAGVPELLEALRLDAGTELASDRPGSVLVQFTRPLTTEDRAHVQTRSAWAKRQRLAAGAPTCPALQRLAFRRRTT
jgi:hypothetical protein